MYSRASMQTLGIECPKLERKIVPQTYVGAHSSWFCAVSRGCVCHKLPSLIACTSTMALTCRCKASASNAFTCQLPRNDDTFNRPDTLLVLQVQPHMTLWRTSMPRTKCPVQRERHYQDNLRSLVFLFVRHDTNNLAAHNGRAVYWWFAQSDCESDFVQKLTSLPTLFSRPKLLSSITLRRPPKRFRLSQRPNRVSLVKYLPQL